MEHFLKVVADSYQKKYKDLSSLTFVLPNKRSGSYLLNYFKELTEQPVIAPRIIPVNDFIDRCIENVKDSRLDLLFRLFDSYNRVQPGTGLTFEKFSSWGETMLADFNEVDMHMVSTDELFKNVSDLNSIRSTFLTDEQKKVMTEYFGYSSEELLQKSAERFWKDFKTKDSSDDDDPKIKDSRKKFYTLWQILPDIYKDFKLRLTADGFTTEGGSYREAALRIESGFEPFKGEKLVFVGFNALAESERRIFKALKNMRVMIDGNEEPKADFIWDMISSAIADDTDPAVKFVKINSRKDNFPPLEWLAERLERSLPLSKPEIEVIAVPSNVMQVKVASEILDDWKNSDPALVDRNVAVVLSDESLLLPLLHSLPKKFADPNLTMGFPLKQTSVISFASLLRPLQMHSRKSEEGTVFLFEDVKNLLSHPYSHILFEADNIKEFLKDSENAKLVTVNTALLSSLGDNTNLVFRHFEESASPLEVVDYLRKLYKRINDLLYENNSYINANIEKAYIAVYNDSLVRLANCLSEYSIEISPVGVLNLADRLVGGEKVAFEGEPLKGLQIMGLLETRCLDFERIVMLSVNEKVIPRVGRNSTFIPNVIRGAYGMPPANYQEEIFAYYFFRLLGRCKRGLLTYDSRSSESRNPGASRYLLQMKYLPDGFDYTEKEARFGMPVKEENELVIDKNDYISTLLDRYETEKSSLLPKGLDPKKFSASALRGYVECPLKFLFRNVLELYIEREKIETIDAIDLGLIIHGAIEKLYIPDETKRGKFLNSPVIINRRDLENILNRNLADGSSYIYEVVRREIIKTHFHVTDKEKIEKGKLRGSAVFIIDYIVDYVKNIIRADMEEAPFRLWGTEIKRDVEYPLPDGRKVNITMVIDRLDQRGDTDPSSPFRIVDYKTGVVHLSAEKFDDIFSNDYNSSNIFQLFLYAELLILLVKTGKQKLPYGIDPDDFEKNLRVAVYSILALPDKKKGIVTPKIETKEIKTIGDLRNFESTSDCSFREGLDKLILTILDRNIPFNAKISESRCRFCDYRLRCEVHSAKK